METNNNLCLLLFNNSNIFTKPYEGFIYLSSSEIILNLLKYHVQINNTNYKDIISEILSNCNYEEMMDLLNKLQIENFLNYTFIEFFLDILLKNFIVIKVKEQFINEKMFDFIAKLAENKNLKKEINDEIFRKVIIKIVFFVLNTKGKYNIENCEPVFEKISLILNEMNSNNENFFMQLNDLFMIFFIEFYSFKSSNRYNISEKFKFIENQNELSDLDIKPINSSLFKYLVKILNLFCSFNPFLKIIEEMIYYLFETQYSFYQIYLQEYRRFSSNEIDTADFQNKFYVCNFMHIFKSKYIQIFYLYLYKYAKDNNSSVFTLFPDFKKILINTYNLCSFPSYLITFFDILQNEEQLKENEKFLKEIIETIKVNESLEIKKNLDFLYSNMYKKNFYNTIVILKCFIYLSYYSKINSKFCLSKIYEYFLQFISILKNNNMIYSKYLIKFKLNNDKYEKVILEICFLITISLLSKIGYNSTMINKGFNFFVKEKQKNSKGDEIKTLFYIFDMLDKSNDFKSSDYQNKDFQQYLSELNCPKEEKSLLIVIIINISALIKKIDKMVDLQQFIVRIKIILYNDLMRFKKNCAKIQKTKNDFLYDLIIEKIDILKKNKLSFEEKMHSFEDIIHKNIKNYKFIEPINNLNKMYNDDNSECYLNNNCLLLKPIRASMLKSSKSSIYKKKIICGDYFDKDLENSVKYFKSDLIFKDCSIFFDDIFFKDKNFAILKKSFLIRYKNLLIGEKGKPLLNYPSKMKNFSSNRYNSPKIFLECDLDFYKSKYFSVCHPNFNVNLLKKDSFPTFPSHYEYFKDLFKKFKNNCSFNCYCELISVKHIIFGKLYIFDKFILFKNKNNFDDKNMEFLFHSIKNEIVFQNKIVIIKHKDIEEIITRAFAYKNQAIEIFLKNGKSYLYNLYKEDKLTNFYKEIKNIQSKFELNFPIIEDSKKAFSDNNYTKEWEKREISTYQYLLYINKFSGRSYNDLSQYPIFPWIFLGPQKEDNKLFLNFRDMKYFMVAQNEKGRELAKKTFSNSAEEQKNVHHFLLHYSNAAYIFLYLIKISPYTEGSIRLQGGVFDSPNRLLISFDKLIHSLIKLKDNRELIPELFTTVENCYNLNYNFYGVNAQNLIVHNTIAPEIFNSTEEYIYFNRIFLNNQIGDKKKKNLFPKCPINKWIDIIFGVNQYPGELEKLNKFDDYSYRQIKNLNKSLEKYKEKKYTNEQIIEKISLKLSRILNFGQCPVQLFNHPHSNIKIKKKKKDKDKKETNCQISKKLDFVDINKKIVALWLSGNKYIFFLVKNKQNKKMNVMVFDDKLNKKNEIIIEKIKLFNCHKDFFTKDTKMINNINENLKCSIAMSSLDKASVFNSFLVVEEDMKNEDDDDKNKDNYTLNDLNDIYALDPKLSMFDIIEDKNIYLFVGRYYDNSIKIYDQNKKIGLLKTDSFVSVIIKIDKEIFLTGHFNGKLLKWKITYKENDNKKFDKICIEKEFYAHKYMISCMHYNERYNIIMSCDIKGILYIRKYYDFQLINKIIINKNRTSFINKIFLNEYDIICAINYNIYKNKNYISFYSINGLLLEESKNKIIIDTSFLKNGKLIFNCLNEGNLFIFGFNGTEPNINTGKILEDNILKELDVDKKKLDFIQNFLIAKNQIYIILKNGIFIKGYYEKLDSLSYGIDKFSK